MDGSKGVQRAHDGGGGVWTEMGDVMGVVTSDMGDVSAPVLSHALSCCLFACLPCAPVYAPIIVF